jgi:hypothetical protein
MSFVLTLCLCLNTAAALDQAAWKVSLRGSRIVELRAELGPATAEQGAAFCRLVPAPGGELPQVEVVDVETAQGNTVEAGTAQEWVSFGTPAVAAGVEVRPLVVARYREVEGRTVTCRSVKLRLAYDRPVSGLQGKGVMGGLVTSLIEDGVPVFDVEQPGYLIIVPDDFYDQVLPLAEWKEQKGFKVWVRKTSETGTQRDEIRDYIQDAYQTWDPVPSYVVLVGAVSKIPAFITGGTPCVTDHPYACVEGSDFMADLFVGRLPAANASELATMVAKIRGYEMTPDMSDPGWFRRALMVGTSYQEGGTPAVTALVTKRVIRDRMLGLGFTRIDTVFYPPTGNGVGPVDSAVNRGVIFVNGRGWGNSDGWKYPRFYSNDVSNLRNGWKLPIVTSIYCGTGNYNANPCFGEMWLRAGSPTEPRGGVAFWGSSWTGTSTRWNNCMDYGIYHAVFDQGVTACAPAMYLGKLAQFENFPLAEDTWDLRVYFHVYNLMGDPSLQMWTGVPQQLNILHSATHPVGTSSFDVTVTGARDAPVEGALVCLHQAGEVHAAKRTDGSGTARFAIGVRTADTMHVTVTGPNLRTYAGRSIGYEPDVFVGHEAHSPSTLSPGGTAQDLAVTLRNFGTSRTATGVQATLRSKDGCAQVTDSVRTYGDIAPGASANAGAFKVLVAPACTSGQELEFGLAVSSSEESWESAFEVNVSGPNLKATGHTVHDANGYLDPGEEAEVSVKVANFGDVTAANVTAKLRSLNRAAIAVLDSSGTFGNIGAGDTAENTGDRFRVRANAGIGVGRRFSLRIVMTGDAGFEQAWDFPVTVGKPVSTAPLGPDRHGYYAYDNTDAGYSETPSYDWVEIDPAHGGSGQKLGLGNDDMASVALPFTFRFYGRDYDTVSVCDNGYVAMGVSWLSEIYNWNIPSGNGPDGFVAVFWDDFRPDTLDASGVYTWNDAANSRFIIEWSRCRHVHGYRPPYIAESQTFQVMLYDPQEVHTETGDGAVVCQYKEVYNDDTLFGNNHNFATAGIQSPDHSDGLEYTFAGHYPAAAARIGADRAIRFTTTPPDTFTAVREQQARGILRPGVRAVPNPARGRMVFELPELHGPARLQVFDAVGREVRRFEATGRKSGLVAWDGKDQSGRRLGAGVYYVTLTPLAGRGSIDRETVLLLPSGGRPGN